MANALGLVGFIAFIAAVVGFAASVTWLVVRISPLPNSSKNQSPTQSE